MKKKSLKIPRFKSEDAERQYWARVDLSRYVAPMDFDRVSFPNLKPSSRPISLRLPEYLIIRLKEEANALDVPYQSLMKRYIAKGVLEKSR